MDINQIFASNRVKQSLGSLTNTTQSLVRIIRKDAQKRKTAYGRITDLNKRLSKRISYVSPSATVGTIDDTPQRSFSFRPPSGTGMSLAAYGGLSAIDSLSKLFNKSEEETKKEDPSYDPTKTNLPGPENVNPQPTQTTPFTPEQKQEYVDSLPPGVREDMERGGKTQPPSILESIWGSLTGLIGGMFGGMKPESPIPSQFSPLTGVSGSVRVDGKKNAMLSTAYSPFSPADVKEKDIQIISGKGYRESTDSVHKGFDVAAPNGTPLYAYLPGKITRKGTDRGYGNFVEWKDDQYGQTHFFAHMQHPTSLNVGDTFKQGQTLGLVGSTGRVDGPHLHWEIGKQGSEIDPMKWVNSHPIKEEPVEPTKTSSTVNNQARKISQVNKIDSSSVAVAPVSSKTDYKDISTTTVKTQIQPIIIYS